MLIQQNFRCHRNVGNKWKVTKGIFVVVLQNILCITVVFSDGIYLVSLHSMFHIRHTNAMIIIIKLYLFFCAQNYRNVHVSKLARNSCTPFNYVPPFELNVVKLVSLNMIPSFNEFITRIFAPFELQCNRNYWKMRWMLWLAIFYAQVRDFLSVQLFQKLIWLWIDLEFQRVQEQYVQM